MDTEARLALTSLMGRYANAIDHGEQASWVATFTEDGLFQVFVQDAETPVITSRGHAELAQFVAGNAANSAKNGSMSLHLFGAIEVVEEQADELRLRTRALLGATNGDGSAVTTIGTYHDVARRVNGEWRFAERVLKMDRAEIAGRGAAS
ncbi:MAG: nuclear transport factor 2 family protein [Chloroflexi bacterium]|nr:nuclear transport factor 2 family protein [Chloroflexota bacterium]MDA1146349.1 nuclear transport factor 2 family protein [Chloroflexota bacterium]